MRTARLAVVASFLLSVFVLYMALPATSANERPLEIHGVGEWIKYAINIGGAIGLAAWPWLKSFLLVKHRNGNARALWFAIVAALICISFYVPVSGAPAEGVFWYLIICTLLVWVSYPLIRMLSSSATSDS